MMALDDSRSIMEIRKRAWLKELTELAEDYAREGIPLEESLQAVRDGYVHS